MDSKKITFAILMNALILPGSGHMMIGYRIKGTVIALSTITFLFIPLIQYTLTLMKAMKTFSAKNPYMGSSLQAMSDAWNIDRNLILPCLLAILILWTYGIVDLLIIKRRMKI